MHSKIESEPGKFAVDILREKYNKKTPRTGIKLDRQLILYIKYDIAMIIVRYILLFIKFFFSVRIFTYTYSYNVRRTAL